MKELNPKYVKLLEKTFEKYRDIDVLRTHTKNDYEKEHLLLQTLKRTNLLRSEN